MSEESTYQPGTVSPYDGMVWDGKKWTGTPTRGAVQARTGGRLGEDTMTRLLRSVVYGVIAVVLAVWAIPAVQLFGAALGGVLALGALGLSFIFGVLALVKIPPKT